MYLCSASIARPDTVIRQELLQELGLSVESCSLASELGILERRSALSESYLRETRNENPRLAEKNSLVTPTELAERAAREAAQKAGIDLDQISLILAGTVTPLETCPSEAQRLGCRLGLKIPAFDIVAGALDFPQQLHYLKSWKKEKRSGYVLCVSTNLPTQRIHYTEQHAEAAAFFGDAAAAIILSPDSGIFQLDDFVFGPAVSSEPIVELDIFAPMKFEASACKEELGKIELNKSILKESGFSFGSYAGQLLAENWESFVTQGGGSLSIPGIGQGSAQVSFSQGEK